MELFTQVEYLQRELANIKDFKVSPPRHRRRLLSFILASLSAKKILFQEITSSAEKPEPYRASEPGCSVEWFIVFVAVALCLRLMRCVCTRDALDQIRWCQPVQVRCAC